MSTVPPPQSTTTYRVRPTDSNKQSINQSITKLEGHSESANRRQRYVNLFRCVRQVAALYSVSPYLAMVKKSFNPILDPDADQDHHQHLITSKLGQV